jgi:hypothetical protein
MTQKARIDKLEKQAGAGDRPTWRGLVDGTYQPDQDKWRAFVTNPYMTMPREDFINSIVAKIEAAERGECEPLDLSQAGEVMRAELARRLDAIAKVQNDKP